MNWPTTRLFHLHYHTPNVEAAEDALSESGFPLRQRFGQIEGESVALDPDDPIPENFRFRLETLQCGYVNLTLAPGRNLRFDHLGCCTAGFETILNRAENAGWSVRNSGSRRRTFIMTPWRFRIELHPDGNDVESDLGAWTEAHLAEIALCVPDADSVQAELEAVLGAVPGLHVQEGENETAAVPRFRVSGDAFSDGLEVDAPSVFG